ncbi:hypothetical protein NL676_033463 [Syzygium grande]|nr:hypothetical protein NL676_033463 [Syzygium grande]
MSSHLRTSTAASQSQPHLRPSLAVTASPPSLLLALDRLQPSASSVALESHASLSQLALLVATLLAAHHGCHDSRSQS